MRVKIRTRRFIDRFRCVDTFHEDTFDNHHFKNGGLIYLYKGGFCYSSYPIEDVTIL